jgi:hypothetical protein
LSVPFGACLSVVTGATPLHHGGSAILVCLCEGRKGEQQQHGHTAEQKECATAHGGSGSGRGGREEDERQRQVEVRAKGSSALRLAGGVRGSRLSPAAAAAPPVEPNAREHFYWRPCPLFVADAHRCPRPCAVVLAGGVSCPLNCPARVRWKRGATTWPRTVCTQSTRSHGPRWANSAREPHPTVRSTLVLYCRCCLLLASAFLVPSPCVESSCGQLVGAGGHKLRPKLA